MMWESYATDMEEKYDPVQPSKTKRYYFSNNHAGGVVNPRNRSTLAACMLVTAQMLLLYAIKRNLKCVHS